MKVLAIGNSFSQDATRYLRGIADAAGCKMKVVNLYIGGCSLATHFKNIISNNKAYSFEFNGEPTGLFVSVEQALLSDEWDVITLQQASHYSGNYDSYQPYLNELAAYVRRYCPKSKLVIHQTWAYEEGCARLEMAGFPDSNSMYLALSECYDKAAKDINADFIIPSGTVFKTLVETDVPKIHRDTFHALKGVGRYALALTWFRALTGMSVSDNTFDRFDEPVSEKEIKAVKDCVEKLV